MCHQFTDNSEGKYHDLKASMKGNEISNEMMVAVLKEATGLAPSVIKKKLLPSPKLCLEKLRELLPKIVVKRIDQL